jgi:hypothetical protein
MVMKIELTGDRAAAENIILEIRALAQKFSLKIPNVTVIREPAVVPKKPIPASGSVGDAEGDGRERTYTNARGL